MEFEESYLADGVGQSHQSTDGTPYSLWYVLRITLVFGSPLLWMLSDLEYHPKGKLLSEALGSR